jgi:phosphate transport system substrate-binding protein
MLLTLLVSVSCAHRVPRAQDGDGRFSNSITIRGSDTRVLPAQWWAENYLALHPQLVIQVNGGGSGTGIAALLNGTTDICQSSRPIREQERAAFRARQGRDVVEVTVALDAIGIYVHALLLLVWGKGSDPGIGFKCGMEFTSQGDLKR